MSLMIQDLIPNAIVVRYYAIKYESTRNIVTNQNQLMKFEIDRFELLQSQNGVKHTHIHVTKKCTNIYVK